MVKSGKVILAAVLIFLAGVASGGVAARWYGQGRQPSPAARVGLASMPWTAQRVEYMRRLANHLSLESDQRGRIDQHIDASQQRLRALWEPMEPQAKEELRVLRKRIESELSLAQRVRFNTLCRERSSRGGGDSPGWRKWEGRTNEAHSRGSAPSR